jgi:NodT family efflux transporter outer membrane factor (OMF) lipoprotein
MPSANVDRLRVSLRTWRCPLLAAVAVALGACASPVPPEAMSATADVPAAWTSRAGGGVADATSLARWWERFDDPALGRLVQQALASNTSVAAARASVSQARALRDVAAAALAPTLSGTGSVSHSRGGTAGAGRASATSTQAGVDAGWVPDVFGGNHHALAAGQAAADASVASLGDLQVQVAAEVGLSYIALRGAQARREIAVANLASQQQTLQITLWRQQAGLVTELDAAQARTAVDQTQALLPALGTTIEQNQHALLALTNRPPNARWPAEAASSPMPFAGGDLALAIPAETLRQRADVRAAEFQVAAALARVQQADAARWPRFSISGTLGYEAASLGLLGGAATLASTLLAGVTLPLFDGGAARAQVRAQQAALDLARINYRAAVLTALQEVEDALVALRNDSLRRASLGDAATDASRAAGLASQQYRSGLVDFQAVLATQRTALTAQDASAQAGADVGADQVRLFEALGGGWRADDAAPSATPSPDRHPALASPTFRP